MSLLLGALYLDRDQEEVRDSWRLRVARLGESGLTMRVWAGTGSAVRVEVRTRRGRRVPHKRMGALARWALGPEREELAEFWLLEPADAVPGALRLEGASWDDCLQAIGLREVRQVRLWSPMVCPGPIRTELAARGEDLGLEMRITGSWVVVAVPRTQQEPPHPAPWQGNYGW